MFAEEDRRVSSLRIVDFGFAKQRRTEEGLLMTPCFTKEYAAPEVLSRKKYDESCDICERSSETKFVEIRNENLLVSGSLGVLLYTLISGNTPYALDKNDSDQLILSRTNVKLQLVGPIWQRVTEQAKVKRIEIEIDENSSFSSNFKSLVTSMLEVDPKKRPTAIELCKHPWFSNVEQLPNVKLATIRDYQLVRVRFASEK